MKTHWKKMHNYDYLGSYSLPDGKDIILTIKTTKKEMVTSTGGQKQECFVCYFAEKDTKPMILNRTNCKMIESLYSPYIEDWDGKRIVIGIEKVKAFGETTDALRIRQTRPDEKKAELIPSHPKWNDAVDYLKVKGNKIEAILKHWSISEENKTKLMEAAL